MNASELKKLIKVNKITQEKLADILKVSRITVNQWCNGKKNIPAKRALAITLLFSTSYHLTDYDFSIFLSRINKTPEAFASFYGVPMSTVKKWRTGKADIPLALKMLILWYPYKRNFNFSSSLRTIQN